MRLTLLFPDGYVLTIEHVESVRLVRYDAQVGNRPETFTLETKTFGNEPVLHRQVLDTRLEMNRQLDEAQAESISRMWGPHIYDYWLAHTHD